MARNHTNTNKLKQLYLDKGATSSEFNSQLDGFIGFLMRRYHGGVDDDLKQSCFIRVVESLKYYDPKFNFGTFVYSTIRNEISKFNYQTKKRRAEVEYQEFHVESETSLDEIDRQILLSGLLGSFRKIKLSKDLILKTTMDFNLGKTHIFAKALAWEMKVA